MSKFHKAYAIINRDIERINIQKLFEDIYDKLDIIISIRDKTRVAEVMDAKKIAVRFCIEIVNHDKKYGREYGISHIARVIDRDHSAVCSLNSSAKSLLQNDKAFKSKYDYCKDIYDRYMYAYCNKFRMLKSKLNPSKYQFKRA